MPGEILHSDVLIGEKNLEKQLRQTVFFIFLLSFRNHAKRMFRHLARCEGFRKALTDAVPETTLRHIDKTLKSL